MLSLGILPVDRIKDNLEMPPACNRHPSLRASAPAADSHVALLDPVTCEASRERLGDKRDDHRWVHAASELFATLHILHPRIPEQE